jgi:hypothetical protein
VVLIGGKVDEEVVDGATESSRQRPFWRLDPGWHWHTPLWQLKTTTILIIFLIPPRYTRYIFETIIYK